MNLAEAVTALVENGPLSSVQFTEITLADQDAREALGTSGAIVYTRLPIVQGVDLETFCPGGQSTIFVADDSDQEIIETETIHVEDVKEEEPLDTTRAGTATSEENAASAASQISMRAVICAMIIAAVTLWL